MSISKLGEFGLIRQLSSLLPPLSSRCWPTGIGDDCSVLKLAKNHYQLCTTDLLLENVHFKTTWLSWQELGYKALAVNLSDIAAMGGVPLQAVIGLGIPQKSSLKNLKAFYRGLASCAKQFDCPIAGGDTNFSANDWVIAVTVIGWSPQPPLLRSGAKPGDSLWVTGPLGLAGAGWRALQQGKSEFKFKSAIQVWKKPLPRLLWAQNLRECGYISSMIDLSDGLAGDLSHLVKSSQLGFELELTAIPGFQKAQMHAKLLGIPYQEILLGGGEDYELLFTVKSKAEKAFTAWLKKNLFPFSKIGKAVSKPEIIYTYQQKPVKIKIQGYQHF